MVRLFLKFELAKIFRFYSTKTVAKLITSLLFVAVFLVVGFGIYVFFVSGFRYINIEAVEDIRLALSLFLYELFLVVFASVIVFSATVSSLFNLYKGENNNWVISSPQYSIFPKVIFVRSLMHSLLPTLVMFVPAVLAFDKVNHLGVASSICVVFSVILLLIILNALTLLFITGITFLYYKVSKRLEIVSFSFRGLLGFIFLGAIGLIFIIWRMFADIDLVELFKAEDISTDLNVANIANHFKLLPTHPFALEIFNFQNGELQQVFFNFSLMVLLALIASCLWWYLSPIFYPMWQKFQEGNGATLLTKTVSPLGKYMFNGSKTLVLFKKEALISSRNFKGVIWFFFLFTIWLLQIGTNVLLDNNIRRHEADISLKLAIIQALQFIIAIYFISSFTLRFVFPSFSVERRAAWILATAPLSFIKIFFGKYLFYTTFFVFLGIVMSYINILALGLSLASAMYTVLLFIVTVIFIVTLGLSLGAIFPSFETDDAEAITTSMPGLFFTALALMYGGLSAWVLYSTLIAKSELLLLSFVGVTAFLASVILYLTPRFIKNRAL